MSLMVIQVLVAVLSTRSDRQSTGTDLDSMLWALARSVRSGMPDIILHASVV